MRLMKMGDNAYLLSMYGEAKMMIDIISQNNGVLLKLTLQGICNSDEFIQILNNFSNYYFSENPTINGMLLRAGASEMLDNIGFKPLNEKKSICI